jgi:hypothetical protein
MNNFFFFFVHFQNMPPGTKYFSSIGAVIFIVHKLDRNCTCFVLVMLCSPTCYTILVFSKISRMSINIPFLRNIYSQFKLINFYDHFKLFVVYKKYLPQKNLKLQNYRLIFLVLLIN